MAHNAAGRVKRWLNAPLQGADRAKLEAAMREDPGCCHNCLGMFDPESLDIHHLCPRCSELAESSTMNSLRHAAGLEQEDH